MKKWISVPLLIFLGISPVMAQDRVELFGYFESQIMGLVIDSEFYQLHTNKLRLDLKSRLSEKITFAANFDYITYHGKTEWDILEFFPDNITSTIPRYMQGFYVLPFSDRSFLDNAYIKLAFEHFDLTIGKQQISLGTGYVWNPTDVFNIKDILDPTYEQPGHNAIRMDLPLGSAYTLTALCSPEDSWKNTSKLLRFKGRISHFDYALIGIEKLWRFYDYTRFDMGMMNFLELPEKRQLVGASTAGELLGLGIWAEYAYNKMENSENFHALVVGADYTFDFQTYLMVEYFRNTLGKTDYEQYDLNDWMRMLTNEQKAIARDQLYVFIQHPITDFINLGSSTIYSISDNSLALVPTLNYSLSENLDIMAYLNLNLGKEGAAFSKNTGNGGLLRARVYF